VRDPSLLLHVHKALIQGRCRGVDNNFLEGWATISCAQRHFACTDLHVHNALMAVQSRESACRVLSCPCIAPNGPRTFYSSCVLVAAVGTNIISRVSNYVLVASQLLHHHLDQFQRPL
jgi:hypothetical protein